MNDRKPPVVPIYKGLFPETWICPFCMAESDENMIIDRDNIINHVVAEHDYPNDITWETLWCKMSNVGGV